VASINNQSYKNFEHIVISDLEDKEAHNALFRTFMERSEEFDLLIKIDADMVLCSDDLFAEIVKRFQLNTWMEVLIIAVDDFFSNTLITGMASYRNTLRWNTTNDRLFTEIPPVAKEKIVIDKDDLAPAAIHCKNPSFLQAFHYGIHRGLKVIQPDRMDKLKSNAMIHYESLEATWEHFLRNRDKRLAFAVLGAELAYAGRFEIQHLDYTNPIANEVLIDYEALTFDKLARFIKWRRFLNFGILSSKKRQVTLQYIRGGKLLDNQNFTRFINGIRW